MERTEDYNHMVQRLEERLQSLKLFCLEKCGLMSDMTEIDNTVKLGTLRL